MELSSEASLRPWRVPSKGISRPLLSGGRQQRQPHGAPGSTLSFELKGGGGLTPASHNVEVVLSFLGEC